MKITMQFDEIENAIKKFAGKEIKLIASDEPNKVGISFGLIPQLKDIAATLSDYAPTLASMIPEVPVFYFTVGCNKDGMLSLHCDSTQSDGSIGFNLFSLDVMRNFKDLAEISSVEIHGNELNVELKATCLGA